MPRFAHVLSIPWKPKVFLSLATFVLAVGVLSGCGGVAHSSGTTGSNPPPAPLSITVTSLPAATVQTSYSTMVSVSGGTAPYRWSIASGALPSGLTLAAGTGQITGTPTQAGTASFTVQVSDSSATVQTASQALSIAVSPATTAVSITTSSLPNGTQGTSYSTTLAASGGQTPYTWSVVTGALPAGLALNASTGQISGTPASTGTDNFTVQVTDASSQTATATFTLTVNAASTLTLSPLGPKIPPAFQGMTYNSGSGQVISGNGGGAVAMINGGTPPYTCSLAAGSVPTGMSLIETTPTVYPVGLCVLAGTPSVHGAFPLSVEVTDNALNTASLNVTFIVVDSNPPTISSVNAVMGSDPSKEVITWTTSVPADSQVIYGEYGNFDSASAIQDAGGVTSHAVTITVAPGVGYQYTVVSRGVVGGTPQDYELNTNGFQGASFTAGSAAAGGTLAWYMRGSGPHNVVQGFPIYVGVYQGYLADASFGTSGTPKWQVTNIPPFTKVHWPDIQDDGCGSACGTVSATTTTDDTFNGQPGGNNFDNNTQFEILTNVGGTTPIGNYTVTVTFYGNGAPITSFNWPINVVSANFTPGTPSNPPLPAGTLTTWATGMTTYGASWCNGSSPQDPPPNEQGVWYYDGGWVFFQIGQYTGDTATWNACAAAVQSQYHSYVLNNLGPAALPGNEIFPDGFYYNAKVLSNGTSSQSATDLHNLAACPACGQFSAQSMIANSSAFFDGILAREGCYMLGAKRLDYDAGGGTTLAQVQQMAAYCLGYVDQLVNYNGYEESFYDGLIAKALIDYYNDPNTGNGDVRVPPAMQALADHLWNNNWLPYYGNDGQFWYGAGTYGQFGPILMTSGTDNTLGTGLSNLNSLIAPLFAWVYHMTGQQKYQLEGDQIWADGVNSPPGNGIGWSGKNYSQQYRWSVNYPLWRGATTGCYTLPACH